MFDEEEDPLADMSTLGDSLAYTKTTTNIPVSKIEAEDVTPKEEEHKDQEQTMWDFII